MPDNQNKSVEELNQEIVDIKIRLKRVEEFILDNFDFSDPHDYIHDEDYVFEDNEFQDAVRLVLQFNTASASFLQRKMSIGYARAARLLDALSEKGIVGPADGAKPRDVIFSNAEKYLNEPTLNDILIPTHATQNEDQYNEAVKFVTQHNLASASFLQRKMSIGYARAARLLDQMEEKGLVGPAKGAKPREILLKK
jgi:DNA segregation ATPase FtsK/SpoIIIE-like protein